MGDLAMTVHQQLRAAYLASGRTMADIGAEAGCSENTVLRIVGPRPQNASMENLIAVAMVLRVDTLRVPAR